MRCVSPLDAWQRESGEIVFVERGSILRSLTLPCGQCIACRLARSQQWAVRCMHEAQLHESNAFVTLTYDDAHLPQFSSLNYRDFQLFMKRLRRKLGPVRFYMCGEYGEKFGRPHFHACFFGADFSDKVLHMELPSGFRIYRSPLLEALWPFGFSSIGDVTFESAAYVARYVMKKVTGSDADCHYRRVDESTGEIYSLEPEFCKMSRRPGIARGWIGKFLNDVFDHDYVVVDGRKVRPPKYYDKFLSDVDPFRSEYLAFQRYNNAVYVEGEGTPSRLAVHEQVAHARLAFKKRVLE